MRQSSFGKLWPVTALTLGGGINVGAEVSSVKQAYVLRRLASDESVARAKGSIMIRVTFQSANPRSLILRYPVAAIPNGSKVQTQEV